MKRIYIVILIFILFIASACSDQEDQFEGASIANEKNETNKKVVLVMMDTMMGSLVDASRAKGGVPALDFLIENGQYYNDLVAPFPSMSVVIESTLLTGKMANEHGIPGLSWYKADENRLVDYGSTYEKLIKLGLTQALEDSIYHLNNTHLNPEVKTIYEELDNKKLTTGSINMLVYRGNTSHPLQIPGIIDGATALPEAMQTKGPDILALGQAVKPKVLEGKELSDSMFKKFGVNDEYSVQAVKALIEKGEQPDFMMVFMPDFDQKAHEYSPYYRRGFERAELLFQDILNSYESWDSALEENIFIIIGDHGSDKLIDNDVELTIDLETIYDNYSINRLGETIQDGDIVFGNNHRMTYVYPINRELAIPKLAEKAMIDDRIAMGAWLEDEWAYVITPESNKLFRFKPGGVWTDRYNQSWTIEGEHQNVTLNLDHKNNRLSYVDYPDVLNQLYSSLQSNDIPALVLTAKPGHTFYTEGAPVHVDGGEHGGLHKNDTLAALIIAGTDVEPTNRRIVDLKEYILELFEKEIKKK